MPAPIRFARITSSSCELAKSYTLDNTGTAIAHMTAGHAAIQSIGTLPELREVFESLTAHQAITAGVPIVGDTPLTTRKGSEFNPNAVARTNENFRYLDTPSLFVIDVDTAAVEYQSLGQVMDALEASSPWLKHALPQKTDSATPAQRSVQRWSGMLTICNASPGSMPFAVSSDCAIVVCWTPAGTHTSKRSPTTRME